MERLQALRRRVESAESLHSIARVMKTLSAVRIRRSREAAESVVAYEGTLERSLQVALRHRPPEVGLPGATPRGLLGSVVFGSDLGLAGQYNARVVGLAAEELAGVSPDEAGPTLAVGGRAASSLEAAGIAVAEVLPAPSDVERLPELAQELLVLLEEWRSREGVERIAVFHNDLVSGSSYRPRRVRLLPLDPEWLRELEHRPWPTRRIPLFRGSWDDLFSFLVREHLFVALVRAAAGAMAAEHASRLAAMEVASRRIEEHLEELRGEFRELRQRGITEELLEVTAGYEALTGGGREEG